MQESKKTISNLLSKYALEHMDNSTISKMADDAGILPHNGKLVLKETMIKRLLDKDSHNSDTQ